MEYKDVVVSNEEVIRIAKEKSEKFVKGYNKAKTCSLESFTDTIDYLSRFAVQIAKEDAIYANYYHIMHALVSDILPKKVTNILTGIEGVNFDERKRVKIYTNFFEEWDDESLEDCMREFADFVDLIS